MKYIILGLLLVGCSSAPKVKENNRNRQIRYCVHEFLDEGLKTDSVLKICKEIYRRQ